MSDNTLNPIESKNIKDYLHLYIGCDVMLCEPEGTPIKVNLRGLTRERTDGEDMLRIQVYENDGDDGYEGRGMIWCDEEEIELILRPLSDMTEEEGNEFFRNKYRETHVFDWFNCVAVNKAGIEYTFTYHSSSRKRNKIIMFDDLHPNDFIWLLSKGFDLFGLIDAGLAIKKSQ